MADDIHIPELAVLDSCSPLMHMNAAGCLNVAICVPEVQRTTVAVTNRAGDTVAQYPASVVGTDASHDLAVLRIDAPAEDLQPIR